MWLLQHVQYIAGPESKAFAENLFYAAIESEDSCIIKVLLQNGLNPNDLVCTVDGSRYTPVERSSSLWNVEITRLLIYAKADVNKKIRQREYSRYGALQHAMRVYNKTPSPPLKLVHMLLCAGADIKANTLLGAIYHYNYLVDLLVDFGAKTSHLDWIRDKILEAVTKRLDNKIAIKIVKEILQAFTDPNHNALFTLSKELSAALDIAAEQGNLELVRFLLDSRACLTERTLTQAVKSTNKDLIRLLLDAGVNVNSVFFDLIRDRTTPLAEAIRWGDIEIINLLVRKGAFSQIKEISRFTAALNAASQVGAVKIVKKLLKIRVNTKPEDLQYALLATICTDQEEITLMLLDAGADANGPLDDALPKALQKRNTNVVWSLLEADINLHYSKYDFYEPPLVEAAL